MSTTLDSILQHCTAQRRIATPLGPMLLARTTRGLAGAWFDAQKHHPARLDAAEPSVDAVLDDAAAQLAAYYAGEPIDFDLPLDLHGTAFQRAVWAELLRIVRGATSTYGAIAARLGRPRAGRAVGAAVGRNPVGIIVPCHRVVGHGGALTGYAGGLDRKTALLAIESATSREPRPAPAQLELA